MKMSFVSGCHIGNYDRRHYPVIEMMKRSESCLFASYSDLMELVAMLERKVDECNKISGAPKYYIITQMNELSKTGGIQLLRKSRNNLVGFLTIEDVSAILGYDSEVNNFFDISERLEDGPRDKYIFDLREL